MERESYFDNIRFGLIILVVLGHAFINHVYISEYVPSFLVFVYSFHMPLFLFVGGVFHSNYSIRKRVLTLLAYLLTMKVVEFFASFIIGGSTNFSLFAENNFGWYLAALCIYTLVTFILRDINPVLVLALAIIIGCMVGYVRT